MLLKLLNLINGKIIYANPKKLKRDWEIFKILTRKALEQANYNTVFNLLEGIGWFGYKYNFVDSFKDAEVDNFIIQLTNKIKPEIRQVKVSNHRIAFYDHFTLENRGFTQQYLDELMKQDIEILYIMADESKLKDDNKIVNTLRLYPKAKIIALNASLSRVDQFQNVLIQIVNFGPSKLFIHNAPWDIISCCLCIALKEAKVSSYLLNITDHAYWPGADIFDYIIDFRSFGHLLNHRIKGIPSERLLIIPTPAYIRKGEEFEGIDNVQITNEILGFSGGSTYKIVDANNTFLKLIKKVLDQNENFVFLFANVGNSDFIRKFIKENSLEERFILLGNRRDINEVFKNIDIYFNTYPYGGGLMIQYALYNKKPILALMHPDLSYTHLENVIDRNLGQMYRIDNEKDYLMIAKKLIQDECFRKSYAEELAKEQNIDVEFQENLKALLNDSKILDYPLVEDFSMNSTAVTKFHLDYNNYHYNDYLDFRRRYFKDMDIYYKTINISIPYFISRVIKRIGNKFGLQ